MNQNECLLMKRFSIILITKLNKDGNICMTAKLFKSDKQKNIDCTLTQKIEYYMFKMDIFYFLVGIIYGCQSMYI